MLELKSEAKVYFAWPSLWFNEHIINSYKSKFRLHQARVRFSQKKINRYFSWCRYHFSLLFQKSGHFHVFLDSVSVIFFFVHRFFRLDINWILLRDPRLKFVKICRLCHSYCFSGVRWEKQVFFIISPSKKKKKAFSKFNLETNTRSIQKRVKFFIAAKIYLAGVNWREQIWSFHFQFLTKSSLAEKNIFSQIN